MKHLFKLALLLSCATVALACSHSTEPTGKATITGQFSGSFPAGQVFTVKVSIPNLVVGGPAHQMDEYEAQLKSDGSFSLSIPLFCDAFGMFSINENEFNPFFLSPDKETKIELSLNGDNKILVKMIKGIDISMEDINKSTPLFMDFYQKASDGSLLDSLRYDMHPNAYRDYIIDKLKEQILIIEKNQEISEYTKQGLYKIMKLTLSVYLFDYEGEMISLYEKQLGMNAIPAYQIYDSAGALKHQFDGFPGIEKMRKMIRELL
jgi:hypothetical protein